jgi:alkanesulfonate monooxygenase SsuD/methylene tetrahydromethanopterin reductase-like flavin-dependent oxidoreductase (luciferase family)
MATEARFAYQIGAVGEAGLSDRQLYREAIADAELLHRLRYDAAWMVEHHFSDYYPQPNPLLFLSHIAAACPGLGLGTAVMVLPWYDPLRFAEDLAMLQTLTDGELHIGMGRGTAKSEYDAFGIPMETARDRFRECWELTRRAMEGGPITYAGHYAALPEPTVLRPAFDRWPNFYGAIGSLESAAIMARLGLPPLCLSSFPDHLLKRIL